MAIWLLKTHWSSVTFIDLILIGFKGFVNSCHILQTLEVFDDVGAAILSALCMSLYGTSVQ